MSAALEVLLGGLELDEAGGVRGAIARQLARKLDELGVSETPQMALAVAGIAKELRAVVDAILEAEGDDGGEFVAGLFAEVGDS